MQLNCYNATLIWSVPYYSHTTCTNTKRKLFIDSYCMSLCHSIVRVPSMLAKGVETINKQTQQTSSHNGLENKNVHVHVNVHLHVHVSFSKLNTL